MKKSERVSVTIYVVVSLIAIVVLIILLARKDNSNENFTKCICTSGSDSGRGRVCQNTEAVWDAYQHGLTENSDLGKIQKQMGGPKWSTVSPGDYDFPTSQGCPWSK